MSSLEKRLSVFDKAGLRFLNQVAKELSAAYERRAAEGETSMREIAQALGCNRSVIYRRLAGDANLTATTIGAMAKALSLRPADALFVESRPAVAANRPTVDVFACSAPAFGATATETATLVLDRPQVVAHALRRPALARRLSDDAKWNAGTAAE